MSRRALAALACTVAAAVAASTARAADDPAALLAPAGTCGPAENQLNLSQAAAAQTMLCLTNFARTGVGLAPLHPSTTLDQAGTAKLAANVSCNEFSHTPCGQPFSDVFAGYLGGANAYRIGENIAWGTGSYGTPRETMFAWLHSTGHRENILNADFQELGVGYLASQTFLGYANAALWSRRTRGKTAAATFVGQVHRSRQDDCSSRGGAETARRTFEVELAPRSAYVLAGPARTAWQHHIPPTKNLRYSITFRTLRAPRRGTAPPADGPPPAE